MLRLILAGKKRGLDLKAGKSLGTIQNHNIQSACKGSRQCGSVQMFAA